MKRKIRARKKVRISSASTFGIEVEKVSRKSVPLRIKGLAPDVQ